MKAKITAILETSDHDGYCSGDECEYKVEEVVKIINIPTEYKNHPIGFVKKIDETFWNKFLPQPDLSGGSMYCELSKNCKEIGLDIHDYRYSILEIEIIN